MSHPTGIPLFQRFFHSGIEVEKTIRNGSEIASTARSSASRSQDARRPHGMVATSSRPETVRSPKAFKNECASSTPSMLPP